MTCFDGMSLDWAEVFMQPVVGPVVVPGVDLTGLSDEERHRAFSKWLFAPPTSLELLDAHIERLWNALPPQAQRRLGCVAVSTGTAVTPDNHAELLGALALIAEAEGTLDEEAEFCETYLTVPWVCAAVAEAERIRAQPLKPGEKRREQVRLAVARHREKQRAAESEADRKKREASEERMETTRSLRAIAIDGEGVSLDDGSHLYRYMAASLADGTVLGELENENGISSAEALEFVAGLPKTDEDGVPYLGVFGYGLTYDMTKWLERLQNKPLFELFHSEDLKPKVRCGDLRLLLIGKCLEIVDVKALKGGKRTKVWDIIKGFQSTFVKALKAWSVGTAEEHAQLEDMKAQRGNFKNVSWERVKGYCKDECRLLAQLVETYIRAHIDAGIDLRGKYHGAGSTSDAFLTLMNALGKRCTRESKSVDFDSYVHMKSAFSRSFFGGRAEVSRIGVAKGPVWTVDIASAYPHVLFELPCVNHGRWHHVKARGLKRSLSVAKLAVVHYHIPTRPEVVDEDYAPPERPELKPRTRAKIERDARGRQRIDRKKLAARKKAKTERRAAEDAAAAASEALPEEEVLELHRSPTERAGMTGIMGDVATPAWGPLPYRTDKGSIVFPASHPGGWAWLPEFSVAERLYPGVVATEAWVLRGRCQCERPYAEIGKFYMLRIEWDAVDGGKGGRGKVLKLGYNGCYGKFAQVIGRNPKYSCRAVAGHITAQTRGRLYEAIRSASDPWNVIYGATDGLIATEPLDPPNPKPNDTTPKTKKWLGVWEIEKHDEDLFLVQPGFYFSLAPKGKARTRGTPLEIIYEYRDKILAQWRKEPTSKPRGLPKQSTFHGVKTSIRPPTLKDSKYRRDPLYGRWTSEHRRINYVVNPKRSALIDTGDESYRLTTWYMHPGQVESAEYKKDPSFVAKDAINDEQPDFVEPLVRGVGETE